MQRSRAERKIYPGVNAEAGQNKVSFRRLISEARLCMEVVPSLSNVTAWIEVLAARQLAEGHVALRRTLAVATRWMPIDRR